MLAHFIENLRFRKMLCFQIFLWTRNLHTLLQNLFYLYHKYMQDTEGCTHKF
jgi:hypothetical protein